MKISVIFCALFFLSGICRSQKPVADTAKELNDLKNLRYALALKSKTVQQSFDQLQVSLDNTRRKMDSAKTALDTIKSSDPDTQKNYINARTKKLKQYQDEIDQIMQHQTDGKKTLQESLDLIKELDARITELSNKNN